MLAGIFSMLSFFERPLGVKKMSTTEGFSNIVHVDVMALIQVGLGRHHQWNVPRFGYRHRRKRLPPERGRRYSLTLIARGCPTNNLYTQGTR